VPRTTWKKLGHDPRRHIRDTLKAPLVERLTLDGAKKVRLAALDATASRTPSDVLVSGLRKSVAADDPQVRYRALEIMIRWLPERAELLDPVHQLPRNDSEQRIRELAKAAL
jgi:hypothetical protein